MDSVLAKLNLKSIKSKLIALFILFGAVPALGMLAVYYSFSGEIEHAYREPVKDTAVSLADVIDRNLFERYGDVQAFGANAAAWAPENWRNTSPGNPLTGAMNAYMTNYGLYRLMILVDTQGQVLAVNTVDPKGKPLETAKVYQQNFANASWFRKAMAGEFLNGSDGLTGTVVEQPSANGLVASIYGDDGFTLTFAAPVKNAAGQRIGVWVNFADFGLVEDIINTFYKDLAKDGLTKFEFIVADKTGQTMINFEPAIKSGPYKRDLSELSKENLLTAGFEPAKLATRGESGVSVQDDEHGIEQEAVGYTSSDGAYGFPGLGWIYIVRTPDSDINKVSGQVIWGMEVTIGVFLVLILGASWYIGGNIANAIAAITAAMRALAGGDKAIAVPGLGRADEIGGMASALQVFKDAAIELDAMMAQKETERKLAEEKARNMAAITSKFQANIGQLVASVSAASSQLQTTAQGMTANAEQTSQNTAAVASASEEAAANVQTIAASAEELSASIGEISRQVNDAAVSATLAGLKTQNIQSRTTHSEHFRPGQPVPTHRVVV